MRRYSVFAILLLSLALIGCFPTSSSKNNLKIAASRSPATVHLEYVTISKGLNSSACRTFIVGAKRAPLEEWLLKSHGATNSDIKYLQKNHELAVKYFCEGKPRISTNHFKAVQTKYDEILIKWAPLSTSYWRNYIYNQELATIIDIYKNRCMISDFGDYWGGPSHEFADNLVSTAFGRCTNPDDIDISQGATGPWGSGDIGSQSIGNSIYKSCMLQAAEQYTEEHLNVCSGLAEDQGNQNPPPKPPPPPDPENPPEPVDCETVVVDGVEVEVCFYEDGGITITATDVASGETIITVQGTVDGFIVEAESPGCLLGHMGCNVQIWFSQDMQLNGRPAIDKVITGHGYKYRVMKDNADTFFDVVDKLNKLKKLFGKECIYPMTGTTNNGSTVIGTYLLSDMEGNRLPATVASLVDECLCGAGEGAGITLIGSPSSCSSEENREKNKCILFPYGNDGGPRPECRGLLQQDMEELANQASQDVLNKQCSVGQCDASETRMLDSTNGECPCVNLDMQFNPAANTGGCYSIMCPDDAICKCNVDSQMCGCANLGPTEEPPRVPQRDGGIITMPPRNTMGIMPFSKWPPANILKLNH